MNGRSHTGDQPGRSQIGTNVSDTRGRHREAMARQTSPHRPHLQADTQGQQWDDADWDVAELSEDAAEPDETPGQRTSRLLARSESGDLNARPRRSGRRLLWRSVVTLAV